MNPETDEADAYRTSVKMLANRETPVDVSLYIVRDAKADRREEERYNVFFFDTPEGEMSLVKVITDTPGAEMQVPRTLRIRLRLPLCPMSLSGSPDCRSIWGGSPRATQAAA